MNWDTETLTRVAIHWMHLVAAVLAVGGIFYLRLVIAPSQKKLSDEAQATLNSGIRLRAKFLTAFAILLLLATGFYNFFTVGIPKGKEYSSYHMIFGVKFILAMGLFFLVSVLSGRAKAFEKLREKRGFWLLVASIVGLVVLFLSSLLKHIG